MKKTGFFAQLVSGLLLGVATLSLSACGNIIYREPAYNYSGRPIPPSGLLQRVLATYSANGSSGGAEILDGLRDTRSNVQDTIPAYFIKGFSDGFPSTIISYPEQLKGYIFSPTDGSLDAVSYSLEQGLGSVATFGANATSAAVAPDGSRFAGAIPNSGIVQVADSSGTFALNLPNVIKVVINQGNSVILAMVRNSNSLYRVIKLPGVSNPVIPPGSVDCEPLNLPVYCVVPVKGTFDHPTNVSFSLDGTTAFVLNCGPECGGTTAGVSFLNEGLLQTNVIPTVDPLSVGAPTAMETLPVANPVAVPGGVTVALANGTSLFLAGQSLFRLSGGLLGSTPATDGLFTGYLSILNLTTDVVAPPISISDGSHSRMIFADDSTLWIGSQQCANGERQHTGQNYNCLTRVPLTQSVTAGVTTDAVASAGATLIPNLTPGGAVTVPYPNTNQDQYYYGNLSGICWVQNYHKVYTAYGGQIHAFNTVDGSEISNQYITIQGTVLDVAYMDALTNSAN